MLFFTVLVFLASIHHGQNYDLPAVCEDNAVCSFVFLDPPVMYIKECNDYETSQMCCATCKQLIGQLGNKDPACPWGNGGDGIVTSTGRLNCNELGGAADCSYCMAGQLFRTNCCQSCADSCPDTQ